MLLTVTRLLIRVISRQRGVTRRRRRAILTSPQTLPVVLIGPRPRPLGCWLRVIVGRLRAAGLRLTWTARRWSGSWLTVLLVSGR